MQPHDLWIQETAADIGLPRHDASPGLQFHRSAIPKCYPDPLPRAICGRFVRVYNPLKYMVPAVWIEQTTYRLQGGCSTAELSRHITVITEPRRRFNALD